jgi:alkaline phosphatase
VRGNPILGLVTEPGFTLGTSTNSYVNTVKTTQVNDMLGLPYTTLGYQNGPGYTGAATQVTYTVTGGTISNGTVSGSALVTSSTSVAQGSRTGLVNMQVPTDSGGFSTYLTAVSGITSSGTATLARPTLTLAITSNPNYAQESAIPLSSETHGGEDVGIFAKGPNAHLFRGSLEQSMIYWIMADALRLNN